jgi:hypothetical protein
LDGRLRENLTQIPEGRWLNMLDVRYVLTDKLHDAWVDDVFYDLQLGASLEAGGEAHVVQVPEFESTALGIVSLLQGAQRVTNGTIAGEVRVAFADGRESVLPVIVGTNTAEGAYGAGTGHDQPSACVQLGQSEGPTYACPARLRWGHPSVPVSITVQAILPEGKLEVRGLSLIDERTGSFQSLVISDQARFRLVHSGDVKIYENLDTLAQAHLVHDSVWVNGDDAALAAMASADFDPATTVVLDRESALSSSDEGPLAGANCETQLERVRIAVDSPELLEATVETCAPALLVVSRAWYPGWEAWVDGERSPVLRANLLLSAIPLDQGSHVISYRFRPTIVRTGAIMSLLSALFVAIASVGILRCPAARRML